MRTKIKRYLSALVCAALLLGILPLSTLTALGVEQQPYKQNRLLAWYDGANNMNGRQLLDTELWSDLSGEGMHLKLTTALNDGNAAWTDHALMINPETGIRLELPRMLGDSAYTVEIAMGDIEYADTADVPLLSSSDGTWSLVFVRAEDGTMTLEYRNDSDDQSYPAVMDAEGYLDGHTLAVIFDQDAGLLVYADGIELVHWETADGTVSDGLYLGHTDPDRRWGGELHAIRIYHCALTAEELTANALADEFNYRQGNVIDPVIWPEYCICPPSPLSMMGYVNNVLVFDENTDMIPLFGFYGSVNLRDCLYPDESDEVQWEGARLMKTEENDTDYDGTELTGTHFDIMYQSFCIRACLTPVAGKDCQFIVIKLIVNGDLEDFSVTTIAYDEESYSSLEFPIGSPYGGIDFDKEGEVQYLIYDVEGIFDDCEQIEKLYVDISGMNNDTEIYLQEIAFFATGEEAYEYAGKEYVTDAPETETEEPDTDAPDTDAPDTNAPDTDVSDTNAANNDTTKDTTAGDGEGCASVVGFGAAAVMVACAAAVALKKRE